MNIDPETATKIARLVVDDAIINNWKIYALSLAVIVVATAAAAYFTSYFRARGAAFATKADFEAILAQVKRTTEVTEQIKADVSRDLQREHSDLQEKLEALKHEKTLTKASYDLFLTLVIDYYKIFYRHYRRCQRVSSADAHRFPGSSPTDSKAEFLDVIDAFVLEWAEQESAVRLILPTRILAIHAEAILAFNAFKNAVQAYDQTEHRSGEKKDAFVAVDEVKNRMEASLRAFLRVDELFPERI